MDRNVWYDGKELTMFDRSENVYATVKMPSTIDGMLATLGDQYQMTVPLADLIYTDSYTALAETTETGQYVGSDLVGTSRCHHLAFTATDVDWEIWVDEGEQPLPRKAAISYKNEPEQPRYEFVMTTWDQSSPPDNVFLTQIPSGAQEIDMLPVEGGEEEGPATGTGEEDGEPAGEEKPVAEKAPPPAPKAKPAAELAPEAEK